MQKLQTIIRSREGISDFLKARPDPDEVVSWICPECGETNTETHFCRSTLCGCGKFRFPKLILPIKGDSKTPLQVAITKNRLEEIDKDVSEYKREIRDFESEIDEREDWIRELVKERKVLKCSAGIGDTVGQ